MIKIIFLFTFIYCGSSFAVTGQVTVLESPLFSRPDETSKILQYKRKGDEVYIHNQEVVPDEFEELNISNIPGIQADKNKDLFIGDNQLYYPELEGNFYKTLTTNGREAYILKEHIFLILKDKRELTQKVIEHDHTDYRISEPLPRDYPFLREEGFRGMSIITLGRPNYSPYSFQSDVIDTEFNLMKEFSFVWSQAPNVDFRKRFFFGLMTGIHHSSIKFLTNDLISEQENIRFFLGPFASYDIYRTKKTALNIYTSTQYYFYDNMNITIEDSQSKEERNYQSFFSFSQVIGTNYQWFEVIHEFDVVLGAQGRFNLPKTYTAQDGGSNTNFWNNTSAGDSYNQALTSEFSLYFAFQSYY